MLKLTLSSHNDHRVKSWGGCSSSPCQVTYHHIHKMEMDAPIDWHACYWSSSLVVIEGVSVPHFTCALHESYFNFNLIPAMNFT